MRYMALYDILIRDTYCTHLQCIVLNCCWARVHALVLWHAENTTSGVVVRLETGVGDSRVLREYKV